MVLATLAVAPLAGLGSSPAFSLFATLTFADAEHRDRFLRDFAPLAEYIRDHEPTTIAYEVLLSDGDPLRVMIMERYRDKENAFLEIHRSSAPFLEFRPKLRAMEEDGHVVVDGSSYLDSMIGFADRSAGKMA